MQNLAFRDKKCQLINPDAILKKGGRKMNKILVSVAKWLCSYGKTNAGMASIRGSYEAPVPKTLQQ